MITVAIVAILAAIALPAYQDYVRRGRIAEATGELGTMRVRLEQFYQDSRPSNYGSTAAACGVVAPTSASFTYTCTWADGTSQTFIATATGKASADMSGYVFTINNANAQATTQYAGVAVAATCWMKRKSDTC